MFKKIFGPLYRKIEQVGSRFALSMPFTKYSWQQWNYYAYAKEGYQENPYIFRGVNFLAQAVSSLDWYGYRVGRDPDGEEIEIPLDPDHALNRIIRSPNKNLYLGQQTYMQALVVYLLLSGIAPTIKIRGGAQTEDNPVGTGDPVFLFPVQPDMFEVKKGGTFNPIDGFKYTPSGKRPVKLRREDVIYLRVFNPLDLTSGFPPIAAAAKAVDMINQADIWNISLLNNDCRPPGMFKINATLDDEEFKIGQKRLEEQIMGSSRAGRPLLGDSDMDWIPFSYSPAEMGYLDLTQIKAREIALTLNIPPKLMSESESQNYASLRAAIKQGIIEGALPIADMFKRELSVQLAQEWGDEYRIGYRKDGIDALQEEQTDLWTRVNASTCLTVNEKRQELGYKERDEGDVIIVAASNVPLQAVVDGGDADADNDGE